MSIEAVSDSAIAERLKNLPGWKYEEKALVRTEAFSTYLDALEFVQRVGMAAEEANHHPDIIMNFKTVTVKYWTHKIGGVSKGDMTMAHRVEAIIGEMLSKISV